MNALEEALRSRTVGLGALARDVRSCLRKPTNVKTQDLMPYYKANIHLALKEGTDDLQITTSNSNTHMDMIDAKEGESVLLEVQISSPETLALQYQWFSNGQTISETTVHRDATNASLKRISIWKAPYTLAK